MPDRSRSKVLVAIAAYNLVQNLMIPQAAYVPANLVAGAALLKMARRFGCSDEDLGLGRQGIRAGLGWGLGGGSLAAAATIALSRTGVSSYFRDVRAHGHNLGQQAYRAAIRFPIGTALFEEVAFRGVIYGMWSRVGARPRAAALASAVSFGLWHLIPARQALEGNPLAKRVEGRHAQTGVVLVGAVATTAAGYVLARLRARAGSLIAPWLVHAAFNTAGYLAGVAVWKKGTP